jgi:hypothetical protein
MSDLDGVAKELALQTGKVIAAVGKISTPASLVYQLHNISFLPGDKVVDSVTAEEGVIFGGGIENVPSEGA